MKFTLSKKQWEFLGKQAGWLKKQAADLESLYKDHEMQQSSKPIFVSLYEVESCYGGPEEGGWWYDRRTLNSHKKFFEKEVAEGFAEKLRNDIENKGLNDEPLSSSRGFDKYPDPSNGDPSYDHSDNDIPKGFSGDARNYQVYVEDQLGENETQGTPHYE